MTESGVELGLADAGRAGIFFVTGEDLPTLAAAGRDAGLLVREVDLSDCHDKATLMLRLATTLEFPAGSGRNWDALADLLRDLDWLPQAGGYQLLFARAEDLRQADEPSFDTLLDILDEISQFWATLDVPFWAFVALPEQDFNELS